MATPTGNGGQVTVTVTPTITATADATAPATPADTTSSTLSLIYIYSASSVAEPTAAASGSSRDISGGAIAGIVVGSVAFLVILALALFCYSRNVARKRRAEIASLHPSRNNAPSRAYSHATTVQGTTNPRDSQYARSVGQRSAAIATRSVLIKSQDDLLPAVPPQELPTPHNRLEMDGSRGVRVVHHQPKKKKRPEVNEVYGSYAHPVELPTGSQTDLVAVIQEMKRLKTSGGSGRGKDKESDVGGSDGYLTPMWPPGPATVSEAGAVSDLDATTDAGETEYGEGTAEERSIHIYYRPGSAWDAGSSPLSSRQSRIAAAMSQASSTGKASRSTMRSSTTTTK